MLLRDGGREREGLLISLPPPPSLSPPSLLLTYGTNCRIVCVVVVSIALGVGKVVTTRCGLIS